MPENCQWPMDMNLGEKPVSISLVVTTVPTDLDYSLVRDPEPG